MTFPLLRPWLALLTFRDIAVGAQNVFIVFVIEDATHQYPNGVNHPVVMTDLLWPIFSRYTLP